MANVVFSSQWLAFALAVMLGLIPNAPSILLETTGFILTEDGGFILLE